MLFKPNTVVIVLQGRHAGKKGVVLRVEDEKIAVVGIDKLPKPITDSMSKRKKYRLSRMITFIKDYNMDHLLVTRYTADLGLQNVSLEGVFGDSKVRKAANEAMKDILRIAMEQDKAKFLFEKLKV